MDRRLDCGCSLLRSWELRSQSVIVRSSSGLFPVLRPDFQTLNVDGTANTASSILEVVELLLRYNGHLERALFSVTSLGRQNMILGHTWLQEHNPEVDWQTGNVEMSRCSPRCCNGCQAAS